MNYKNTIPLLLFFWIPILSFSQTVTNAKRADINIKWTTNPFDHKLFIENNGQFDNVITTKDKILFGAQLGEICVFFTSNGIIYKYNEIHLTAKTVDKDTDKDGPVKQVAHYLNVIWYGSNPGVSIIARNEQYQYYSFPNGMKSTIRANVFKEILYKNLYKNIDVEFLFPDNKNGMEYSL